MPRSNGKMFQAFMAALVLQLALTLLPLAVLARRGPEEVVRSAQLGPSREGEGLGAMPLGLDAQQQLTEAYRLVSTWQSPPGLRPAGYLLKPAGLTVDVDGKVYVLDTGRGMVHVFQDGQWLDAWGGQGAGSGQLAEPHGIAIQADRILVADTGNRRVVVFGKDGRQEDAWTNVGTPWGVAAMADRVLVSDKAGDQILVLDPNGRRVAAIGASGSGPGQLRAPTSLTAWRVGQLAVLDSGNARVQVLGVDGTVNRIITTTGVLPAVDLAAMDATHLLITNQRTVSEYDLNTGNVSASSTGPSTGNLVAVAASLMDASGAVSPTIWATIQASDLSGLRNWTPSLGGRVSDWLGMPSPLGELSRPRRIAVAGDTAWVLDAWPRLQRFTTDGTPQEQFTQSLASEIEVLDADVLVASGGGLRRQNGVFDVWNWQPNLPPSWLNGVTYDAASGRVVALDSYQQALHELAADGTVVATTTLAAASSSRYEAYTDVAVAPDGRRLVVNRRGAQVEVYTPAGALAARWPVVGVPLRVAAGPDGSAFVLTREGRVFKLDPGGILKAWWDASAGGQVGAGSPSDPRIGPGLPSDLAVGPDGRVFVADTGANLVRVYAPDPAASSLPPPDPGGCRFTRDKTAAPPRIQLGEQVTVTLSVAGQCFDEAGVDVMLVVDRSGSMAGRKMAAARQAAVDFVGEMNFNVSRVGLVVFNTAATQPISLTREGSAVVGGILGFGPAAGGTDIGEGVQLAATELAANGRPGVPQILVVMTDGRPEAADVDADDAATAAKAAGVRLFSIGFGSDVDQALLTRLASTPEDYFFAPTTSELGAIYTEIARRIASSVIAPTAVITDEVPANMTYVVGSARPPIASYVGNVLRWEFSDVRTGLKLDYRVQPQEIGTWPTNVDARMRYTDGEGKPGELIFPIPKVIVEGPPRPPVPIYLPILEKLRCRPVALHVDVALVIDTSSTMAGPKLQAAQAAAIQFVNGLNLPSDRAAVVGFHRVATLASPLSGDPQALHGAIMGLGSQPGTVIDAGLQVAMDELTGQRARTGALRVIVLLSDGLNNAGAAAVRQVAANARDRGILIYAVAFGEGADLGLLGEVTGSPRRLYATTRPEDLAAIYAEIAGAIGCE